MSQRIRILLVAAAVGAFFGAAFSSTLEEEYIAGPGWCPGVPGATIQAEHMNWHTIAFPPAAQGKEFLEFHREFVAQSDDWRLYGLDTPIGDVDPDPAAIPVLALPGSLLRFAHTDLNGYLRPALHAIDPPHPHPGGGNTSAWTPRPANLKLRNAAFHGFTANGVGTTLDGLFHGNGHMSIAFHDQLVAWNGDMGNTLDATRDGAFFQWHTNIDNIYADWALGQYQKVGNTGQPIYFSVVPAGTGAAGTSLRERRQSNEYQGNNPPGANQYGAIPRIGSDVYVADRDMTNRVYHAGVRVPGSANGWDRDAFTVLNPDPAGWFFSVTPASVGLPGTAVNLEVSPGGDVFQSAGGGTNVLFRTEAQLGLLPASTDNLDAVEVDQQKRVQATNDTALPGVYDRPKQWFSLRSGSIFGVKALGGAAVGPADILRFDPDGNLVIAVPAATLGAGAGDELDAVTIVDTAPLDVLNGTDRIYYSYAAGSAALGANSPADIFCHTVAGAPCGALGGRLEATAAMLGLAVTDDIDALDVATTPDSSGACCFPDGSCAIVSPDQCTGKFWGPGTVCEAADCPSGPGACCLPDGSCTMLDSAECLAAMGTYRGAGTTCAADSCPPPPGNDDCDYAYEIPYDYQPGYEPPADNTYAYPAPYDPPYPCHDHMTFFPPYGSGTIWYYYDVPVGVPPRPIYLTTAGTYDLYQPGGDYAWDTRLGLYYSPSGSCSTLVQVACGDNSYDSYDPPTPPYGSYASLTYDNQQPGRYYVQLSTAGDVNRGQIVLQVYEPTTGVPEWSEGADAFRLSLATSNPVRGSADIRYELPRAANVKLAIYDAAGRRVATLVDGGRPGGSHRATWDGHTSTGQLASAGVYFVRIEAAGESRTAKLVLIR